MTKKIAFVFPGQGSQSVGMLSELAGQFPLVKATYEQASDALDYDLWQLVQAGPVEILNQTQHTQPALLAAGVAVWRVWSAQQGAQPVLLAGHSLGEYTALVCAGALEFAAAIRLVAARGRYMQEAVPEGQGAMAAIVGLSDEQVREICAIAAQDEIVASANFNAPGQVVVAGNSNAVERCIQLAKATGAKIAKRLPVSVPSHCGLMQPAAQRLAVDFGTVEVVAAKIPVIHNVDVTQHTDVSEIKKVLIQQLYSSVRWVETVQKIAASGINTIIECGPGKVLAGLNKRIINDVATLPVYDSMTLMQALEECK